jgi:Ca2+-binding EF-hand superfamily protein
LQVAVGMMPRIFMLLALAVSSSAWANDAGSEARFNELDRNGDGFVSRDEGREAEELNTRFSELDVNNDGKLSRDEYAVLEREAAEKQAKDGPATRRSSAAGGSKPKEPRTLTGEK